MNQRAHQIIMLESRWSASAQNRGPLREAPRATGGAQQGEVTQQRAIDLGGVGAVRVGEGDRRKAVGGKRGLAGPDFVLEVAIEAVRGDEVDGVLVRDPVRLDVVA